MTKTPLTRRRMLRLGTASAAALGLAGCLGDGQPGGSGDDGNGDGGNGDDGNGDGNETDPDSSPGNESEDGNGESGNGDGVDGDGNESGENGDESRDGPPGTDLPRRDEPPYEITVPECGEDEDDRDDRYLCANMPADPSLEFEQATTSGSIFEDEGLEVHQEDGEAIEHEFYVALLADAEDRDRVRDEGHGPAALIADADFAEQAVLVVETGWGSGSILPHVKRLEETDDGVNAHGCYRRPCAGTTDVTVRTAAVRFERPDALEEALVSLTVDEESRYHVAASEDVVSIVDAENDGDG